MFGALIFTFLRMPRSECENSDPRLDHHPQHLLPKSGWWTLVGLVSKNGILIVEFANKLQQQGHAKRQAVKQAAITRLRPVLMTSAATIAGHFPLTLVTGAGAEARNSIGLVARRRMAVGTFFTLS